MQKQDDILFINAAEQYKPSKRQNSLEPEHINRIVETYRFRPEHIERFARRVSMEEVERNGFNLNISRYVSTSIDEVQIKLDEVNARIKNIEKKIVDATAEHNKFLTELGLASI